MTSNHTTEPSEKESCPSCGALPCDWVNDPHVSMGDAGWLVKEGRELHDDRVRPLLLAQADKRGARDWRDEDAEQVIAALLARLDRLEARALSPSPDDRITEAGIKLPVRVEISEVGEGPDRRPIGFLIDDNDRYLVVDEEPPAVDDPPSPVLAIIADLMNGATHLAVSRDERDPLRNQRTGA